MVSYKPVPLLFTNFFLPDIFYKWLYEELKDSEISFASVGFAFKKKFKKEEV